jgi:DNA polymerase V
LRAGFPSPAEDVADEGLDFNKYLVRHKASTFVFTLKGDSMCGAGLMDGDKIVVDRAAEPKHGDIVVAVVGQDYTVKRLYKRDGKVELHPENPDFPAIRFSEGEELVVWGVVTGVVRRLGG